MKDYIDMKIRKQCKTEKISIRCTVKQKKMIIDNANKHDMKTGDYIIMCVECKEKRNYSKILGRHVYAGICDLLTEINYLPDTKEYENIRKKAEKLCASLNM